VASRNPLTIACCVSYARINERYVPRASLEIIRRRGEFGCGVPFVDDAVVNAIRYTGNVSINDDREKVAHAGLDVVGAAGAPILRALPIHFECVLVDQRLLGTHAMFLGQVRRIIIHRDLKPTSPLDWCAWAAIDASGGGPACATAAGRFETICR
jgi:flavin reductase (DIM6/NTAB) family NADH-FMN oxidoreductase RutF